MAPENQPNAQKPNNSANDPTRVREPDNTRPPSEPTPRHPEEPQQAKGREEDAEGDAETEGM